MKTVCCVCHKTKTQTGWVQRQSGKEGKFSHGYCPDCFSRTMERAQGWLLSKTAGNHGLAIGR